MPKIDAGYPRAKVLIVDDHPAVREAAAIRISQTEDLQVCGEAANVASALKIIAETKPDLVIVDISLKEGSGLELIKRVAGRDNHVRFLVWSMYEEEHFAERSLRAGAMGYLNKQHSTKDILTALRQILAGKVFVSDALSEKLLMQSVGDSTRQILSPMETLSDREVEVLTLIGNGRRTADIAKRLHLSIKTIETYRDRIRHKLDLADGVELARYAAQWVLENA